MSVRNSGNGSCGRLRPDHGSGMVFSGRNASGGLFIAYSRIIDYHLFVSFDPFLEYFKIKLFELRSGRQQQPPIAPSSPSKYFFFTY
jgi:hypothetical protein